MSGIDATKRDLSEALDELVKFAGEDLYQQFDSYDEWKAALAAARSRVEQIFERCKPEGS